MRARVSEPARCLSWSCCDAVTDWVAYSRDSVSQSPGDQASEIQGLVGPHSLWRLEERTHPGVCSSFWWWPAILSDPWLIMRQSSLCPSSPGCLPSVCVLCPGVPLVMRTPVIGSKARPYPAGPPFHGIILAKTLFPNRVTVTSHIFWGAHKPTCHPPACLRPPGCLSQGTDPAVSPPPVWDCCLLTVSGLGVRSWPVMLPGSPGGELLRPGSPGLPQPGPPFSCPFAPCRGRARSPHPRPFIRRVRLPQGPLLGSSSSWVTVKVIPRLAYELFISNPKYKLTVIEFISSCHRSRHQPVRPFCRCKGSMWLW